jgi:hypothetical protein
MMLLTLGIVYDATDIRLVYDATDIRLVYDATGICSTDIRCSV